MSNKIEVDVVARDNMTAALSKMSRAVNKLTKEIRAAGNANQNLSVSSGQMKNVINQNIVNHNRYTAAAARATKANRALATSFGSVTAGARSATGAVSGLNSIMRSVFAATIITGWGTAVVNAADGLTDMENRLKSAGYAANELGASMQFAADVAVSTRTNLEAAGTLLARMTRSSSRFGYTMEQNQKATRAVLQSFQLSGATVQESQSSVIQLTQALGAGRLAGDELRSILENAPILAYAIAEEMGVAHGKLKKLGSEGKITTDIVMKAMLNSSDKINENFAKLQPTFANSFEVLKTGSKLAAAEFGNALDKAFNIKDTMISIGTTLKDMWKTGDLQTYFAELEVKMRTFKTDAKVLYANIYGPIKDVMDGFQEEGSIVGKIFGESNNANLAAIATIAGAGGLASVLGGGSTVGKLGSLAFKVGVAYIAVEALKGTAIGDFADNLGQSTAEFFGLSEQTGELITNLTLFGGAIAALRVSSLLLRGTFGLLGKGMKRAFPKILGKPDKPKSPPKNPKGEPETKPKTSKATTPDVEPSKKRTDEIVKKLEKEGKLPKSVTTGGGADPLDPRGKIHKSGSGLANTLGKVDGAFIKALGTAGKVAGKAAPPLAVAEAVGGIAYNVRDEAADGSMTKAEMTGAVVEGTTGVVTAMTEMLVDYLPGGRLTGHMIRGGEFEDFVPSDHSSVDRAVGGITTGVLDGLGVAQGEVDPMISQSWTDLANKIDGVVTSISDEVDRISSNWSKESVEKTIPQKLLDREADLLEAIALLEEAGSSSKQIKLVEQELESVRAQIKKHTTDIDNSAEAGSKVVSSSEKVSTALDNLSVEVNNFKIPPPAIIHPGPGGSLARANGGPIYGPGTATSDSIPAMLSDGEFVIKAKSAKKIGLSYLNKLNQTGEIGAFKEGTVPTNVVPWESTSRYKSYMKELKIREAEVQRTHTARVEASNAYNSEYQSNNGKVSTSTQIVLNARRSAHMNAVDVLRELRKDIAAAAAGHVAESDKAPGGKDGKSGSGSGTGGSFSGTYDSVRKHLGDKGLEQQAVNFGMKAINIQKEILKLRTERSKLDATDLESIQRYNEELARQEHLYKQSVVAAGMQGSHRQAQEAFKIAGMDPQALVMGDRAVSIQHNLINLQEQLNSLNAEDYAGKDRVLAKIREQEYAYANMKTVYENNMNSIKNISDTLRSSLKSNFSDVLKGAKTLKEGIKGVLNSLTSAIIDQFVNNLVDSMFSGSFSILDVFGLGQGSGVGGGGGGDIFSMFSGGSSFGNVDGALSFLGYSKGGIVPNIKGSSPGKDSVPILAQPGEAILPKNVTDKIKAGKVGPKQQAAPTNITTNINVTGDVDAHVERAINQMGPKLTQRVYNDMRKQGLA